MTTLVIVVAVVIKVLPHIQDQWTALHWAALNDHVDAAKLLIAAGADMNAFDRVSMIVILTLQCTGEISPYISSCSRNFSKL